MTAIHHLKPPQTQPSYADLDLAWREACWDFLDCVFAGAGKHIIDQLKDEMYRARQARGVERS